MIGLFEEFEFEEVSVGEGEGEDDFSDDVVDDDDDELEVEELEGDVVDDVVELLDDGGGLAVVCMTGINIGCPITAMIGTLMFFILSKGSPEEFGFEQASVGEGEGDVSHDIAVVVCMTGVKVGS